MVAFHPDDRPTIKNVLRHHFFGETRICSYTIISTPTSLLSPGEVRTIERMVSQLTNKSDIIAKTLEIYSRCAAMENSKGYNVMVGCYWIATKLITGVAPDNSGIQLHQVVEMERKICRHLNFSLHTPSVCNLFA